MSVIHGRPVRSLATNRRAATLPPRAKPIPYRNKSRCRRDCPLEPDRQALRPQTSVAETYGRVYKLRRALLILVALSSDTGTVPMSIVQWCRRSTPMHTTRSVIAAAVLAMSASFSGMADAADNVQLLYSGIAVANSKSPPATATFANWCGGICFPTVHQSVQDPSTGQPKGTISVWGKGFEFGTGGSLCFSEFIVFGLDQGEIHVASGVRGTCGAPIDPALKPPLHQDLGALVVIAGGGDGSIVGGTGKYMSWSGTYTDRVFVGFGAPTSGVGGIVYYDQLWFSISGK
jgi:hypothetical protein